MRRYYSVYIMSNLRMTVFYTGVSNNLRRRVYEHKEKIVAGFTKMYNITKLLYFEHYERPSEAIKREKQIKGWRRQKKLELIREFNPDFKDFANDLYI